MDPQFNPTVPPQNQNGEQSHIQVPPNLSSEPIKTAPSAYVTNNGSNHKKIGPIITTFVIIVVIIALALYLFASKSNNQQPIQNDTSSVATQQSAVDNKAQSVQSITNTSDDIQSLQNDLNNSTIGIDNQNF